MRKISLCRGCIAVFFFELFFFFCFISLLYLSCYTSIPSPPCPSYPSCPLYFFFAFLLYQLTGTLYHYAIPCHAIVIHIHIQIAWPDVLYTAHIILQKRRKTRVCTRGNFCLFFEFDEAFSAVNYVIPGYARMSMDRASAHVCHRSLSLRIHLASLEHN